MSPTLSLCVMAYLCRSQDDFDFQGLQVSETVSGAGTIAADGAAAAAAELAQVDFRADFCQKGTLNLLVLKERSTFRRDGASGAWLYAQGEVDYDAQAVQLSEAETAELHRKMKEQQEAAGG